MWSPTDIDAWVGRLNQRRECCFAFGRPRGVVSSLLLGDPMWSPLLAVSSWFPACAGKTFAARHSLLGTLHGLWPVVCQRSGIRTHDLHYPKVARYRAALYAEGCKVSNSAGYGARAADTVPSLVVITHVRAP